MLLEIRKGPKLLEESLEKIMKILKSIGFKERRNGVVITQNK